MPLRQTRPVRLYHITSCNLLSYTVNHTNICVSPRFKIGAYFSKAENTSSRILSASRPWRPLKTCHFRKRATSAPAEGPASGLDFARHCVGIEQSNVGKSHLVWPTSIIVRTPEEKWVRNSHFQVFQKDGLVQDGSREFQLCVRSLTSLSTLRSRTSIGEAWVHKR